MKKEINWNEVNRQMNEQFQIDCQNYGWLKILEQLSILTRAIDSFKPGSVSRSRDFCPKHGGKKGDKFVLLPRAEENGAGKCFKCGEVMSGFTIVAESNGTDFIGAVKLIKELLYENGKQPYPWQLSGEKSTDYTYQKPVPKVRVRSEEEIEAEKKEIKKRRAANRKILTESFSINSDCAKPLRDYFISRAIFSWGDFSDSLRYHPALKFIEMVTSPQGLTPEKLKERNEKLNFLRNHRFYKGEFNTKFGEIGCDMGLHPAAVFIMRNNNTLEATSLQRVYLSQDGNKMELDGHHGITIKKRTARIPGVSSEGSSCHIDSPFMKVIGVAEGPETTLAVRSCIGLPMNCTVDAGGLGEWIPNEITDRVVIFTDKDKSLAGRCAAEKLKARLEAQFIEAIIMEPPLEIPDDKKSVDWQDAVEQLGITAFPDWLVNWGALDF